MKRILEIGSGQGFNSYILSKNKKTQVIGIDISAEDIRISKERYPHVDFRKMSAEALRFNGNYFDEVYAMDVLEHVDNINKVVSEANRVLKKDGRFIINIPHYATEAILIKIRPTYFKEIHHVRVFQENELDDLLKKNGFAVATKSKRGFLNFVELFFLLRRNIKSTTQLSIGSWRDNYFTMSFHASMLYFDPTVIHTPLVYFPIWLITLPLGFVVSLVGNLFFPKSFYYVAIKNK